MTMVQPTMVFGSNPGRSGFSSMVDRLKPARARTASPQQGPSRSFPRQKGVRTQVLDRAIVSRGHTVRRQEFVPQRGLVIHHHHHHRRRRHH